MLSHYRPPPVISGCTQAVWLGEGGNHDSALDTVSSRFELTSWSGRRVIAKVQRPWGGCLDGMNEDGLIASMTFGGSPALGLGFSAILMLRYALETCRTVNEATSALSRIPIAQSHNVTLLDKSGAYATLLLGPDRVPAVAADQVGTNHQERVVWPEHGAMSRTVERREAVVRQLAKLDLTLDQLVERFLAPLLYSRCLVRRPSILPSIGQPSDRSTISGRATLVPVHLSVRAWRVHPPLWRSHALDRLPELESSL
jgi:predicted choloylglycine hydrolase